MTEALLLHEISKSFAHGGETVRAVDDVSLAIRENEFFTLLGPSGCGKTTLLRLVAGLEKADSGTITLAGQDITHLPAYRRPVNTVFQSYALFPHMTVAENVAFGLQMQGKSNIAGAVDDALKMVRLESLKARKPQQLSGGQQQRVALARALVNRPQVLLLDEPLSALDHKLRREMQLELKRLQRDTGVTFVFVTHDQDEALSMSDRIAVMNGGKVAQLGTPQDIYDRPATRFVADFVGTCNFVAPETLGLPPGGEIGFRPESAAFGERGLAGKILQVSYRGGATHCVVRLESGAVVTVAGTAREGEKVHVSVDPGKAIRCGQ